MRLIVLWGEGAQIHSHTVTTRVGRAGIGIAYRTWIAQSGAPDPGLGFRESFLKEGMADLRMGG